jgi:hypothetical protein
VADGFLTGRVVHMYGDNPVIPPPELYRGYGIIYQPEIIVGIIIGYIAVICKKADRIDDSFNNCEVISHGHPFRTWKLARPHARRVINKKPDAGPHPNALQKGE